MDRIAGLSLFSGIGGIDLAISSWVRTICYCECDRYAQGVLLSRMQSNDIDRAPIWTDVRSLSADLFRTKPEIIFGGFPCQDISVAGLGKGLAGERSGLFFEIARLTGELKPTFVFLENVPAIRTRGGEAVGKTLAGLGYDCRWTTLSAAEVGANHKRERWFLMAHAYCPRKLQSRGVECELRGRFSDSGENAAYPNGEFPHRPRAPWDWRPELADSRGDEMADALRPRREKLDATAKPEGTGHGSWGVTSLWCPSWWAVEPNVGRVAYGVQARVDRIKCLGNAVVPLQAREAFKELLIGRTYERNSC